jgi:creatinine amidohydrolase
MRIADMHWMEVEAYLKRDDRCVIPLGSTEQHAQLSLSVDSIVPERLAIEAAEPLGVPVFPVQPYGITPNFLAYPGTVSLRLSTYDALIRDMLDSLRRTGFRRILLCNGHSGNAPAQTMAIEWMCDNPGVAVRFHSWWASPRTSAKMAEVDPVGSHASWSENFPWTRLPDTQGPDHQKPMIDVPRLYLRDAAGAREMIGDGNFGGHYQRSDDDMMEIWKVAVEETRSLIEGPWT